MWVLKYKKWFLTFSAIAVIVAIGLISIVGLEKSIDFSGGTVYSFQYEGKQIPEFNQLKEVINKSGVDNYVLQKVGNNGFVVKLEKLSDEEKNKLDYLITFNEQFKINETNLKTVGPTVSDELTKRSITAIILVVLLVILFIAYVFRHVSKPVSSFKYGLVAIIALIHDVVIPTGVFALLGHFFIEYQIDVLFVTALLAILGYSVNDTIVIFDRIRENLKKETDKKEKIDSSKFKQIVGVSLEQSFKRSILTSLTTFIVLLSLFMFGPENLKAFSLVLMIGVFAGTYSSIFLASPLLILIEQKQKK